MSEIKVGKCIIRLLTGDITDLNVDAIVNAANKHLILGSGVAGAIREKGGATIQAECEQIGGTFVGGAVITGAGRLSAKHVIHAVGPRYGSIAASAKLRNATINSLKLAIDHDLSSIAFPAISTGVFGFPIDECSQIMLSATLQFLDKFQKPEMVIFCLWGQENYSVFEKTLRDLTADKD
jgi:O-acetyl-ADP-ribose deacetylase (regulator of RNase III)